MATPRLLLLSNSKNPGMGYLEHALSAFQDFLGPGVRRVCFIPFAGVTMTYDDYAARVAARFEEAGYALDAVHQADDPKALIDQADAIAVGGGNTFHLLKTLYDTGLLGRIRARVQAGTPYVGWSAGSNVACPTIKTTNDMPIVEPPSFRALNLVPFQINPHYTDAHPPGHQGETRAQRLEEFTAANAGATVVGLLEGSMLRIEGADITLLGDRPLRLFQSGAPAADIAPHTDLSFLLG